MSSSVDSPSRRVAPGPRRARGGHAHRELVCRLDGRTHLVETNAYDDALASEPKSARAACGRTVLVGALGATGPVCAGCAAAHRAPRRSWMPRLRGFGRGSSRCGG